MAKYLFVDIKKLKSLSYASDGLKTPKVRNEIFEFRSLLLFKTGSCRSGRWLEKRPFSPIMNANSQKIIDDIPSPLEDLMNGGVIVKILQ